jgi:hypothetical protein
MQRSKKTIIDPTIPDTECPGDENLKSRFARSLRMNFQQLGDAAAVNKAMAVELKATETHLKKAWQSNEAYYRSHYRGFSRLRVFLDWFKFKRLDLIWGNGASLLRLIRSAVIVLLLMTARDVYLHGDPNQLRGYWASFIKSLEIFFGTLAPDDDGKGYLALITFVRLGTYSLRLSNDVYKTLERARISCTRAVGRTITDEECKIASTQFPRIEEWMNDILARIFDHEARARVQ